MQSEFILAVLLQIIILWSTVSCTNEPTTEIHDVDEPCPPGYRCSGEMKIPCPKGTYKPEEGNSSCINCPERYFCPFLASTTPWGLCDDGYLCPEGSVSQTAKYCGQKHYCIQGVKKRCPNGTFQYSLQSNECVICPEGVYCLFNYERNCYNGHYCLKGEIHYRPRGNKCKDGHRCPKGVLIPCSKGTYQPRMGKHICLPCPVGYFCNATGLKSPSGSCDTGWCCELGEIEPVKCKTPDPNDCQKGSYRPDISSDCVTCPKGMYCASVGLTSPSGFCEDGWNCQEGSITATPSLCLRGHFCKKGYMTKCQPGTYQSDLRQITCITCPPGKYCQNERMRTSGALCRHGYMCTGGDSTAMPPGKECPAGYKCPTGTFLPVACDPGQFMNRTAAGFCDRCPIGSYCNTTAMTAGIPCPDGYECRMGTITPILCRKGYYCLQGIARVCEIGTYQEEEGSWQCKNCPSGSYCEFTKATNITGICPAGFFCPERTINPYQQNCSTGHYCLAGSGSPTKCPVGLYQPEIGQIECLPCPYGKYCAEEGLSYAGNYCAEGWYCMLKETSDKPLGQQCLPGHKCPTGSAQGISCPSGYYQPMEGQAECLLCPIHQYCNQTEAVIEKQSGPTASTHGVVTPKNCPHKIFCKPGSSEPVCEIDVYTKGALNVSLNCEPDCNVVISKGANIAFSASCADCDLGSNYTWTLRRCVDLSAEMCYHCKSHITYINSTQNHLILDPNSLPITNLEWNYFSIFLKVTLQDGRTGMAFHIWQYLEKEESVKCNIIPPSGIAFITEFTVYCDYSYQYYIPTYFMYASIDGEVMQLSSGSPPNNRRVVLPPGDSVHVTVVASVRGVLLFETVASVQVKIPIVGSGSQTELFEYFLGADGKSTDKVTDAGENEGAVLLQSLTDVLTTTLEPKEEFDSDMHEETEVLFKFYIDTVAKLNVRNVHNVQSATSILNKLTQKKEFLSEEAQDAAMNIYDDLTQTFAQNEKEYGSDELKHTARRILTGVSTMIDVFTDTHSSTPYINDTGKVPERTLNSTVRLLTSLNMVSDILLDRQKVGEDPTIIKTKSTSLMVKKELAGQLSGTKLQPEGQKVGSESSITFPHALAYGNENETIGMQLMLMKNPYVWSDSSRDITSPVLEITLKDSSNNIFHVANLKDPVKITTDFHKINDRLSIPLALQIVKNPENITLGSSDHHPSIARLNFTVTADKITALSLNIPESLSSVTLHIGTKRKPEMEDILLEGYRFPQDTAAIKEKYSHGYMIEFEKNTFDNKTIREIPCLELLIEERLQSFMTLCNVRSAVDSTKNHCQNNASCVGSDNTTSVDSLSDYSNTSADYPKICEEALEDLRSYSCPATGLRRSSSSACTSEMSDCLQLCLNMTRNLSLSVGSDVCPTICNVSTVNCTNKNQNAYDMIYFAPNMSMFSEDVASYVLYFGVSVDLEDVTTRAEIEALDPECLGGKRNVCISYLDLSLEVIPTTLACMYWDDAGQKFSSDGCQVSNETTADKLECLCDHMTAFASSVIVMQVFVDPIADVELFLTFFDNPVVVTAVLIVWMVYIFLVYWAKRADKQDLEKVGVIVCDNSLPDMYIYLICVKTGWWKQAGTTANVFIDIKGATVESPKRCLTTGTRKCFQSGDMDWFLITTKQSLGHLEAVTLWHDNSGTSPHWYVNSVYVKDVQTKESWTFIFNDWLATDRGNIRQTTTTLQAFTEEDLKFKQMYHFMSKITNDIRDGHIWVSIFSKPARSTFTRVQRLTCALSLLLTTMLTNIMIYGIPTDNPEDQLTAGEFSLSLSQLVTGMESSIIIFPINLLIVQLFMKVKPKPRRQTTGESSRNNWHRRSVANESEESETVVKNIAQLNIRNTLSNGLKGCLSNFDVDSFCRKILAAARTKQQQDPLKKDNSLKKNRVTGDADDRNICDYDKDKAKHGTKYSSTIVDDGNETCHTLAVDGEGTNKSSTSPVSGDRTNTDKRLQWWFVYVAWMVAMATCFISSYFVMLYGLKYGYTRSVEWLVSFLTGFTQSMFVQQPIKVIGLASVLTLICKKTVDIDEVGPDFPPAKDEEYVQQIFEKPETHIPYVQPLSQRLIGQLKQRLRTEWLMDMTLLDLMMYLVYITVILLMVHGHKDITIAYQSSDVVKNIFVHPQDGVHMAKVDTLDKFHNYISKTLLPGMSRISETDHTHATLGSNIYLMGPYRFRQLRIQKGTCTTVLEKFIPDGCQDSYRMNNEDTQNYDRAWNRSLISWNHVLVSGWPWIFRPAGDLKTIPFTGTFATYSGGGYVLEMPKHKAKRDVKAVKKKFYNMNGKVKSKVDNKKGTGGGPYQSLTTSEAVLMNHIGDRAFVVGISGAIDTDVFLEHLGNARWIDDRTRAVFIEFTVYNPNVDILSIVTLLFEFTAVGAVFPSYQILTTSVYHYSSDDGVYIVTCEVLFILFNLMFMYTEVSKYRKNGRKIYFADFWNYFEIAQILLSLTLVVLFIQKIISMQSIIGYFKENGSRKFINFYPAAFWDNLLLHVMAFHSGFVILKTVKLLRFNQRINSIAITISNTFKQLVSFLFIFILGNIAFGHGSYIVFGPSLVAYRGFGSALMSNYMLLLGRANFDQLFDTFSYAGPIFVFVFVISMVYCLLTMFTIILNVGRIEVKHKLLTRKSKFELMEYVYYKMKMIIDIK